MSDWQLIENGGRLMFVCDDFENDAAVTLSGDFGDKASRDQFAQLLLAKLNTRATDAELDALTYAQAKEAIRLFESEYIGQDQANLWAWAVNEARNGK